MSFHERKKIVCDIWDQQRRIFTTKLDKTDNYSRVLYDLQNITNLLFDYAYQNNFIDLLDEVAELCLIPLDHLNEMDEYWFFAGYDENKKRKYVKNSPGRPFKIWGSKTGDRVDEDVLNSSQFLFLISHAIHCFVSLPSGKRTFNMRRLFEEYTPIVMGHYNRWIFDSNGSDDLEQSIGVFHHRGWGCKIGNKYSGRYNHLEFLKLKLDKKVGDNRPYCNGVYDKDMWIVTGAIEMLAAHSKESNLFELDAETKAKYLEYFSVASRLIESRIVETSLLNFNGEKTFGYNFDPGISAEHHDNKYAGYTGDEFPEDTRDPGNEKTIDPNDHPVPGSISWDISHARRFVQMFETLYRNRDITGRTFPRKKVLQGLANQICYKVFNGDFSKPLFRNFFDGSNGWYRVNYGTKKVEIDGKEITKYSGFAYAPYDMSLFWLKAGYSAWQRYQGDLGKVCDSVWKMAHTPSPFRIEHYESPYYDDFRRKVFKPNPFDTVKSEYLLNFIAGWDFPKDVADPPELSINRTRLYFGALENSNRTHFQSFSLDNSGGGTLNWSSGKNVNWLNCSEPSGVNAENVMVSVNPTGLPAGTHKGEITVRAPKAANPMQTIEVTLNVYKPGQNKDPFGNVGTPVDGAVVQGSAAITGWVLDEIELESVRIYRAPLPHEGDNLIYIGDAIFVEDARPDVEKLYPQYPNSYKAGWGYMLLSNFFPNGGNGEFKIYVRAKNSAGNEITLGSRTIICDNKNAVKPFGAIDRPKPGEMVSGDQFRILGWVLTPMPNKIPEDGSTINVYIDNKKVGNAKYNVFRPDIEKLFPGYANSSGAQVFFDVDTTQFNNGIHTLYWVVTDSAGNTEGVGSRYFRIQN